MVLLSPGGETVPLFKIERDPETGEEIINVFDEEGMLGRDALVAAAIAEQVERRRKYKKRPKLLERLRRVGHRWRNYFRTMLNS